MIFVFMLFQAEIAVTYLSFQYVFTTWVMAINDL